MSAEEQRLADLLKRAVPEPPRELTYEEIMVPHANRSRKSWLMPTLAAAAVVAIGVTVGAVATHHSGPGAVSFQPAGSSSASLSPSASPSPTNCASGGPGSPSAVIVPNVVGEQTLTGVNTLESLGFEVVQAGTNSARGSVVSQSPAAGTKVARGSVVTVYVSGATTSSGATAPSAAPPTAGTCPPSASAPTTSPSAVVLPNFIGQTVNQARFTLQADGFTVTVSLVARAAPSSAGSVPPGVVWSQSVPAGSAVRPGTAITLFYQPAS